MSPPSRALARVRALIELGRYPEAVAAAAALRAQDPTDPLPHCLLARAHLGARDFASTVACAEAALTMQPDDEWAHRLRATGLLQLGRLQEATTSAQEGVRLLPDHSDAHALLAELHYRRRDVDQAEASARLALEHDPDNVWPRELLARIAMVRGAFDDAEGYVRAALILDPEHAQSLVTLGLLMRMQLRRSQAALLFARAAALDPSRSDARRLAVRMGRPSAWGDALESALEPTGARADAELVGLLREEYHRDQRRRLRPVLVIYGCLLIAAGLGALLLDPPAVIVTVDLVVWGLGMAVVLPWLSRRRDDRPVPKRRRD